MNHSFNVDVAKSYGVESAVLLENILFWIEKNRANKSNLIDGRYWVYTSQQSFAELFPYMSKSTVQRALKRFIDDGVLVAASFNKKGYDRTRWYALTPHGYSLFKMNRTDSHKASSVQNEPSSPVGDTEVNSTAKASKASRFKMNHPCGQNEPTIPVIKEDIKEKQKTNPTSSFSKTKNDPSAVIEQIVENFNCMESPFPTVLKITPKRKSLVNARIKDALEFGRQGKTKLFGHCKTTPDAVAALQRFFMLAATSEFMTGNNDRGWVADFDHLMSESGFMAVIEGKRHSTQAEREAAQQVITGDAP